VRSNLFINNLKRKGGGFGMKKFLVFLCMSMAFVWITASNSIADTYKFTATSTEYGALGYLVYDSSMFSSSAGEELLIDNSKLLGIDFSAPGSDFHITTPGEAGSGTWFLITDSLPMVIGGDGFTGGSDWDNGVWIAGDSYVSIGLGTGIGEAEYYDVQWMTVSVPEPTTMLLLGSGLVGLAGLRRKFKK
jgi:hypothetical protein